MTVFVLVYFLGELVTGPDNEWFYAVHGLWSLLIVMLLLTIDRSKVIFAVCVLEMGHIIVNFITCFYYLGGNFSTNFMYVNYPLILNVLDGLEAIILFIGAPWGGVFKRIKRIFGSIGTSLTVRDSNI